jgi:hypothetical protein
MTILGIEKPALRIRKDPATGEAAAPDKAPPIAPLHRPLHGPRPCGWG